MRCSLRVISTLASVMMTVPAWLTAQSGLTITGQIKSNTGGPLANANVFIQGLNLGASSREDGQYTIVVPAAQATGQATTLVARRLGYQSDSVSITLTAGSQTHDFTLTVAATQLEGVVVTALGIERDKRSLGVAQQTVVPDELTSARETNVVNALSGKVSGVEITNNGPPGGSARIVIRGDKSITGNNQPLFVVDGIPIDNSA
ncbi:MAG TPA: carboxypeptidase-like regulatory domain-containing protein, partial [Vicinamibacterales bacterium]